MEEKAGLARDKDTLLDFSQASSSLAKSVTAKETLWIRNGQNSRSTEGRVSVGPLRRARERTQATNLFLGFPIF